MCDTWAWNVCVSVWGEVRDDKINAHFIKTQMNWNTRKEHESTWPKIDAKHN